MSKIETWLIANKVLLVGLISAIAIEYQQLFNAAHPDPKTVVFGIVIAALGYLGKTLHGQFGSIVGILGTSVGQIWQELSSGSPVGWPQIIGSTIVAVMGLLVPPSRSINFEKTSAIAGAKIESAQIDKNSNPPINPAVQNTPPKTQ